MNGAHLPTDVLRCRGVVRSFLVKGRMIRVLDGVDLLVHPGEAVLISGKSGSGKTTLVSLLGTLDRADMGSISLGDAQFGTMSGTALARLRSERIGIVFQNHNLLPSWTALENVEAALIGHGKARRDHAAALLDDIGLGDRLGHLPAQLSAGEQQRVAVARALANSPALILADEPTADVDADTAREIISRLISPVRTKKAALVVVTHGTFPAEQADTIYFLREGRLAPQGSNAA